MWETDETLLILLRCIVSLRIKNIFFSYSQSFIILFIITAFHCREIIVPKTSAAIYIKYTYDSYKKIGRKKKDSRIYLKHNLWWTTNMIRTSQTIFFSLMYNRIWTVYLRMMKCVDGLKYLQTQIFVIQP